MATEPVLKITNHGRVRLLTLNRPDRRNALSKELKSALANALIESDFDRSVSVMAITGTGNTFCSCADLKDARSADEDGGRYRGPLAEAERSLFEVIIDSKKPLMAILNGPAVRDRPDALRSLGRRIAHGKVRDFVGLCEAPILPRDSAFHL